MQHDKATRLRLFNFSHPSMRAFHMTWFAFFVCFLGWFGIAPLMAVIREELHLTKAQVGNTMIASVSITIIARLLIGWVCDRIGPRLTYTALLTLGSIPVMAVGLAHDYTTFLLARLAIGAIGASFVITQYHTPIMFAPNVVGTANATAAGWGNLGGGVAQMIMPVIFTLFIGLGLAEFWSWRMAMIVPGVVMLISGVAYFFLTQDTMAGNFRQLRREGRMAPAGSGPNTFLIACRDHRAWALAVIYGACFGIELTIHNIAALYFKDYFDLSLKSAGLVAGTFGSLALFARALGGWLGDKAGIRWGLQGRVTLLGAVLFSEGAALLLFSQARALPVAIALLLLFGLFVHMSCGATYSVTPFINRQAMGSVAGIVGAGGNVGAMLAGFLFRAESIAWPTALLIMGAVVVLCSALTLMVSFSPEAEHAAREEMALRLTESEATA